MASPPSFNNTVILVTGSPVGVSEINAELATQNVAGYWVTAMEFIDANNVALLFVKNNTAYTPARDQKVNAVAVSQAAINADKATEIVSGWWPTGVFVTPGADMLILYTELYPTT